MAFKGLFIGIDRYASQGVRWLSFARRDAMALHALFSDTLDGTASLLVDNNATRAAIEQEFIQLFNCDADDIVAIAFSGHGSQTHELVTYDADLNDLSNSCISLDILTEWFSRIPARRLVCFLDCCFSGDAGAKVLRVDAAPRRFVSVDSQLDQLSGNGRLIFTASSATEEAWEHSRLGHGLLTYYLLEALQGAEEVRQSDKLAVYRLLEYVTQRVIDSAAQLGKPQHPTLRGQIDGELMWPIFRPGPAYQAAFPCRFNAKVTSDLQSLKSFGFPVQLLQSWAGAISSLNQLQIDAINDFNLFGGEHLVVSAPTSSGKTMIGELAALKGALERKRALFLLPLKALVNDKQRHFSATYGAYGIQTIEATGETDDIGPLIRGQYDICLLTYEKFAAVALTYPHILEQIGTIIIDEIQMIADESRGANLEFILTLLRMRRQQGIEPQLIALSGVIGDTNELERWLGARLIRRNERPVPLEEGLILSDGRFRFIDAFSGEEKCTESLIQRIWGKGSSQDWIIPLVQQLVTEGKQVIVFRETKGDARGCARYLARELRLPPVHDALEALPVGDPTRASQELRQALQAGVAFHIADLDREERRVIEEEFRKQGSNLRVIVATTTLAMGVNTPAEAVIIAGLAHPLASGVKKPYSVAEYKNMVGRAGRLGYNTKGTSYLLALNSHEEYSYWRQYVTSVPENLQSRFLDKNTDPRSWIIRVLVATPQIYRQGMSAENIVSFLEASFGAFRQLHQLNHWQWDRERLTQTLLELVHYGLVKRNESEHYELTGLGRLAGEAVIEVESVIRLVDCLRSLEPDAINDPTLITIAQMTVELDQVLFPLNKSSTQKEPFTWTSEIQKQAVPNFVIGQMHRWSQDQHQRTLRAKKAVACLLYITNRTLADIENILTQFGGASDGASGAIRAVATRTCDILPTVAKIAVLLYPSLDLEKRLNRLLLRLDIGIPATTIHLAMHTRSRLSRGDYLRLIEAGLADIEILEASSNDRILDCLNGNREKLICIREAIKEYRQMAVEAISVTPILEPYQG